MISRLTLLLPFLLASGITQASASDIGVLIRFGLKDTKPTVWDGTLTVSAGKVLSLEGWRFADQDAISGADSWKASTRIFAQRKGRGNNQQKLNLRKRQKQEAGLDPIADNGVLAQLSGVAADSLVSVKTPQGEFSFKIEDLKLGGLLHQLDGGVSIQRIAATQPLTAQDDPSDDDYPTIAMDKDGGTWVSYTSFTPGLDRGLRAQAYETEPASFDDLAKPTGGDQVWLSHRKAGAAKWEKPISITGPGADVMRCAVALNDGQPWVIWSEGQDGHFAVQGAPANHPDHPHQVLSTGDGSALSPVAATDAKGALWMAWQQEKDGAFRIYARHFKGAPDSKPILVSEGLKRNCWSAAIATAADGRVAIAWDNYEKGDYDVYVRQFDASGQPGPVRVVANSPNYESRPSLTYDTKGRLWIAWEESGPLWGKDWGAYVKDKGIGLYKVRHIGLRILDYGVWKEPVQSHHEVLPGQLARGIWEGTTEAKSVARAKAANPGFAADENKPGRVNEGQSGLARNYRKALEGPGAGGGPVVLNNLARIYADPAGRVWLLCRTKQGAFQTPLGSVWLDFAIVYDGDAWQGPVLISHTDNLLFNLPAIAGIPHGIRLAHSTDHRQDRLATFRKFRIPGNRKGGANSSLGATKDPFINGVYVSDLTLEGPAKPLVLKDSTDLPEAAPEPSAYTVDERGDLKAIRAYRKTLNGTELRILRGEFHRHTEISGDGGGDGPLEDMWRYALDVASMDWIGCGDHDNGGGREYTWWLTQKTTDAYHIPGTFDPLFTYERSVSYPEGHRNVIFVQRGVRTLPRLPISDAFDPKPAPDTQMLYKYLHHFNGICASHTSATAMGTDWRDNDPAVEPFVEIYQGARQNYERPGAPRSPTADNSIGGWEPKGMINLALLKGYRLAFESSSDHGSTHISYSCVYAKEATRQGIFDAMKLRHTYAATDNIIADVRAKTGGYEYMMGDEFTTKEAPSFHAKFIGTSPFAKITIIKDDVEVQVTEPKTKEVNFTWTDPKPQAGKTSYYYIRGEQDNSEIVWASPMWIKYAP